jgi:predicted dienelactone hydrolase
MTRPCSTRLSLLLALPLLGSACADEAGEGETNADEVGSETTEGESETESDTETETETETGDDGAERDELIAELSELGPYAVGYKALELTYFPPGATEERLIEVLAWYPAAADSGAPLVTYAIAGIVDLPSDVALDNPPVSDAGTFPVAVYSHGSGGEALVGYPYAEHFASHGWIVLSPGHAGNTALDTIGGNPDPFVIVAVNRPKDISAILDELDGGFAGDAVAQASDLSSVFVFGHSFGGYTTLAVGGATLDYAAAQGLCSGAECDFLDDPEVVDAFEQGFGDPRVDAIAPQAPALIAGFIDGDLAAMPVPTMLQSGKLDKTTPDVTEAEPAWAALTDPEDVWINLPFGAHYSFITVCDDLDPELLALFQPDNVEDGCGPEFTPTHEIVPVLGTYLLAYARMHVLGEMQWSVVLEGETLHPEADLYRH